MNLILMARREAFKRGQWALGKSTSGHNLANEHTANVHGDHDEVGLFQQKDLHFNRLQSRQT